VISEYNAYWHNGKIPDYMFNAKEFDEENGMYYYEARYYNPPMFISRDPLFEKYPYMSPYAYCLNNPLIFIDPTGKDVEIVCPETQQKYAYTPGMPVPDGASDFVSNTINSLNAMHSTKNGNTVLGELVNSSNIFSVTNEVSSTGNPAFASNANGGGTLKMGNSTNLNAISHELFHGYQHENGQGGASIFNEVEAYLFAWSVSSENSGDRGYLSSLSSMNPNTINGQSFDNSINNLQFGTMFSKQDFSNVMNLFKAEADVNKAGTYNQYPRQRANQTKSLLQRFYPLNK
jgi:RHS repeat-associated protein